ncbi:NUDIX hydrolase [Candidatus Woesebacteria bacterium]|nr:NUDIX hydrolase [Candidatus Woesebacteria bacterium]
MSDEQVDILDENHSVLYSTLKTTAHQLGLLHKTVIGEVINKKGEWLLVKQSSSRQDPGQYVSPIGGHVRAAESCEEALKREAMEELGISVETFEYIGNFVFNRSVIGRKENHLFVVYEVHCDQQILLNEESVGFVWMSPTELRDIFHQNPSFFGASFHAVVDNLFPHLKTNALSE